jgi:hypothetical protein
MIHIGFTGTRHGMSPLQEITVWRICRELGRDVHCHHGSCVGADAQFHESARECGWTVETHPCNLTAYVANCAGDIVNSVKPPLVRNADIVNASLMLIATPMFDGVSGGTWHTIKTAKAAGVPIIIVDRDGDIRHG